MSSKLVKGADRKIAGVCSGLANYFNMETSIMRVIFILAFLLAGAGILLYLILWLVMPNQ
ncbi:MAG: PspC domain-containing protein [Mangrovibacterium sp.]